VSFTTPQSVPGGPAQRVLEVQGRPPASLLDFDGDVSFVVGEEMRYLVQGAGRVTGDEVRFHEKDVHGGKDVRVWQVRQDESHFVAEPVSTF
jgi:hypothetical protein